MPILSSLWFIRIGKDPPKGQLTAQEGPNYKFKAGPMQSSHVWTRPQPTLQLKTTSETSIGATFRIWVSQKLRQRSWVAWRIIRRWYHANSKQRILRRISYQRIHCLALVLDLGGRISYFKILCFELAFGYPTKEALMKLTTHSERNEAIPKHLHISLRQRLWVAWRIMALQHWCV